MLYVTGVSCVACHKKITLLPRYNFVVYRTHKLILNDHQKYFNWIANLKASGFNWIQMWPYSRTFLQQIFSFKAKVFQLMQNVYSFLHLIASCNQSFMCSRLWLNFLDKERRRVGWHIFRFSKRKCMSSVSTWQTFVQKDTNHYAFHIWAVFFSSISFSFVASSCISPKRYWCVLICPKPSLTQFYLPFFSS